MYTSERPFRLWALWRWEDPWRMEKKKVVVARREGSQRKGLRQQFAIFHISHPPLFEVWNQDLLVSLIPFLPLSVWPIQIQLLHEPTCHTISEQCQHWAALSIFLPTNIDQYKENFLEMMTSVPRDTGSIGRWVEFGRVNFRRQTQLLHPSCENTFSSIPLNSGNIIA